MKSIIYGFFSLLILIPAQGAVTLPRVFSDHMVLQGGQEVPIWGSADPGEKILLRFRSVELETVANPDGQWKVSLPKLKPGGPDELKINDLVIKDVLVGHVWLGSGQSNMAGGTRGYARKDKDLAKMMNEGPYPNIRLFHSKGKGWMEATPDNIAGFSALLFSFGHEIQQHYPDIPIGLMVGAVGGTPSGRWIAKDMLMVDEACRKQYAENVKKTPLSEKLRKYEAKKAAMKKAGKSTAKLRKPEKSPPFDELKPGSLFESHIRPLVGYGITGVLWDQGESGTMFPEIEQDLMMGALISGWRKAWGQGDFPWIYIQKPSGGGCAWEDGKQGANRFEPLPATVPNDEKRDGSYREMYTNILQLPHTSMAITRDLGPGVHPMYKSAYGKRAALVARGMVYKEPISFCGPLYGGMKVAGSKIRIQFLHPGTGLTARHADELQGFTLAGKDRVFHWAQAEIDDETVIVSHPEISKPVAVRYGWNRSSAWANLFNQEGLPAPTFRTDDW